MTPAFTFFIGLALLVLFGWYFVTDFGSRKRIIALVLSVLVIALSLATIYPPEKKITLGLDIKGGTSFLIRLVEANKKDSAGTLEQAVEVIRKRVDHYGGGEPLISPVGDDRILVQIPGLEPEKIQEARGQLSRVAKLEFALVHPQNRELLAQIEAGQAIIPPDYKLVTYKFDEGENKKGEEKLLVRKRPDLTGNHVTNAFPSLQSSWEVSLEFDAEGAKKFDELAGAHFQERFAIILDGDVQSAPSINAKFYGGRAVISGGRMGEQESRNLASVLENPLQTPVSIEEERSVSPTLGEDSVRSSVMAGLVGLLITLLVVLIYYRLLGFVTNVALIVNLIVLMGALTLFNFVLTLPGIAGIILTIGMAVDANVLINERLREELALGKSLKTAMQAAYDKAFSAILDGNVTTLITAVILFMMATGPVKGFAISLTLGIIASMFAVLIVGRNLTSWLIDTGRVTRITMASLINSKNVDFMRRGLVATLCSLALLLGSGAVFVKRGERNFGVDFRGGDLLTLSTTKPVSIAAVRQSLESLQLGDASIQQSQQADRNYITVRSPINTSGPIQEQISRAMPDAGFKVEGSERVGALVGGELARNSLWALALGLVGILIYVTFRFELSFAIGAIVAVLHDVLITIGIFALLDRELSLTLVGAILTIAGYSINDTIVVFDRIREGLASGKRGSIKQIMNESINQTLSRTVLTGGATLIPLFCLFMFGGTVLRDFALAIIIGVLVGTYSSIFIASPIVLWWSRLRGGGKGDGTSALRKEITQKAAPASPLVS